MEKLCAFCKHFDWEGLNYHYYSPETGGTMEGGATCKMRHFYEERPSDTEELRALFLKAQTCSDYTPPNAKVSGAGTASAGLPGYTAGDTTE